jgi:farnesyl diphosphate synthase
MNPGADLEVWLAPWREAVLAHLRATLGDAWPPPFAEALVYPVETGGKRVRPALVLAAYEAVASDPVDRAPALAPAAAVELVHTYSLVHDDLPSMDDDAVRRGRPTVHVAYGEGPAVLVGDALLTEAFAVLARAPAPAEARIAMVQILADAAGHRGMVGGQAADIGTGGPVTDLEGLTRLHGGKTGALITAAVLLGGLAGGADAAALGVLEAYGRAVGLAFQLADDLLDADEVDDPEGPPSFVRLLGVPATRDRALELADEAVGHARRLRRPEALAALARFTVERGV